MKSGAHAAAWVHAARSVTAQVEREGTCDVGRKRDRLQVKHQLDVLFERVRHSNRRSRQLAWLTAAVLRLDFLDSSLDLAHIIQVFIQSRTISRTELFAQPGHRGGYRVENAAVLRTPLRTPLRRRAGTD